MLIGYDYKKEHTETSATRGCIYIYIPDDALVTQNS